MSNAILSTSSKVDFCPYNSTNCSNPNYVHVDIGTAASYVTIVSCSFSCLGSVLIILTYFLLKDLRTGSQKIITLLAVADLISAVGYILGSANYIHHYHATSGCDTFTKLCRAQASVTSWSSLVSFCWTVILAIYFFLIIVFKRVQVASTSKLMIVYNVVAWGVPLIIVVPLLACDKLGYAHYAASNWCFVKDDPNEWLFIGIVLVAGKFWEILSYMVLIVLYLIITVVIGKTRRQVRNTVLEPRVIHVETRLLAIPVIFILLRMWGTLQFFFSIVSRSPDNQGCVPHGINITYEVFGILQAIGDGGQGWGNAILYILLSPVMRRRLVGEWCGTCVEKLDDHLNGVAVTHPVNQPNANADIVNYRNSRGGNIKRKRSSQDVVVNDGSDGSVSENSAFIKVKASGYNIRKYDTTTSVTEGIGTGSSFAT